MLWTERQTTLVTTFPAAEMVVTAAGLDAAVAVVEVDADLAVVVVVAVVAAAGTRNR